MTIRPRMTKKPRERNSGRTEESAAAGDLRRNLHPVVGRLMQIPSSTRTRSAPALGGPLPRREVAHYLDEHAEDPLYADQD